MKFAQIQFEQLNSDFPSSYILYEVYHKIVGGPVRKKSSDVKLLWLKIHLTFVNFSLKKILET